MNPDGVHTCLVLFLCKADTRLPVCFECGRYTLRITWRIVGEALHFDGNPNGTESFECLRSPAVLCWSVASPLQVLETFWPIQQLQHVQQVWVWD